MEKAIITVVGKDGIGIIASICTFLAQKNINILDITQTIIDLYFNMIMICDVANINDSFASVQDELVNLGKTLNVDIKMQHSEIFESMHRI